MMRELMRRLMDRWFAPVAVGFGVAYAMVFGYAAGRWGIVWIDWIIAVVVVVLWTFSVRLHGRAREDAGRADESRSMLDVMDAYAYERAQLMRERDEALQRMKMKEGPDHGSHSETAERST